MRPRYRKGVVMLQTLVMSVILSLIAAMVMKWVLSRYTLAARNYRSTTSHAGSRAVMDSFSRWQNPAGAPPGSINSFAVDGRNINISYSYTGYDAYGSRRVQVSIDEDQ